MLAYTDIVSEEATFLPGKKYPKDRFIETYDFVFKLQVPNKYSEINKQ